MYQLVSSKSSSLISMDFSLKIISFKCYLSISDAFLCNSSYLNLSKID